MVYLEKARELAKILLETEEGKEALEARKNFLDNEAAVIKLTDFNNYQESVQGKIKNGEYAEEEIEVAVNKAGDMFKDLNADPIIGTMIAAENKFNSIVNQAMNVFSSTLTGKEPTEGGCSGCSSSDGCSGGCN